MKSVFREMEEVGVVPNHFSYATLIDSLFKEGNEAEAFAFQGQIVVRRVGFDVVVYTASMCETPENPDFLRKDKMVISVKIRNFSRSRMTKWTLRLESSREI